MNAPHVDDDRYIYRVFDRGQYHARTESTITVKELTMAGSYDVVWEIVSDDEGIIGARRLKRVHEREIFTAFAIRPEEIGTIQDSNLAHAERQEAAYRKMLEKRWGKG